MTWCDGSALDDFRIWTTLLSFRFMVVVILTCVDSFCKLLSNKIVLLFVEA